MFNIHIVREMKAVELMIRNILIVGFGGSLGALMRYMFSQWIHISDFPLATFLVNGLGSFLLSVVTFSVYKNSEGEYWKLFLGTGICGGFTTMSTFALETYELFTVQPFVAVIYMTMSMIVGFGGAYVGYQAALHLGKGTDR